MDFLKIHCRQTCLLNITSQLVMNMITSHIVYSQVTYHIFPCLKIGWKVNKVEMISVLMNNVNKSNKVKLTVHRTK